MSGGVIHIPGLTHPPVPSPAAPGKAFGPKPGKGFGPKPIEGMGGKAMGQAIPKAPGMAKDAFVKSGDKPAHSQPKDLPNPLGGWAQQDGPTGKERHAAEKLRALRAQMAD